MGSQPSLGQQFFQQIMDSPSGSLSYLRSLVNSTPPTVETEYLDFKSASVNGAEIKEGDIKKSWSEAVAGFATTSGGVIVWGIDARKLNGSAIDQACGFNPVLDPEAFKSRLKQLLLNAADPPMPNIQIEAFSDPADGGKGFVVCYTSSR